MMRRSIPLLEKEYNEKGIISPEYINKNNNYNIPAKCIMVMVNRKIEDILKYDVYHSGKQIYTTLQSIPIYIAERDSTSYTVVNPGMGSSFVVGTMEKLIALGCRYFVAIGFAGVLSKDIEVGKVIIPQIAVRDEGTSYHYVQPAWGIHVDRVIVDMLGNALDQRRIEYVMGNTWTTDALFRETPSSLVRRIEEGCITVEMECSALLALAQFRGVFFGQYLVAGDCVSEKIWDRRLRSKIRVDLMKLVSAAMSVCSSLEKHDKK